MIKDNTERYWYLHIRKNEAGIVTETKKGFYIYDYTQLKNTYAGNSMLTLAKKIRELYNLFK